MIFFVFLIRQFSDINVQVCILQSHSLPVHSKENASVNFVKMHTCAVCMQSTCAHSGWCCASSRLGADTTKSDSFDFIRTITHPRFWCLSSFHFIFYYYFAAASQQQYRAGMDIHHWMHSM